VEVLFANAITLPAIAAACAVLFYFTEKPFMGNRIVLWITGKRPERREFEVGLLAEQG